MPPVTPRMSYALRKLGAQKSVRALRGRFTEKELTHQAARVTGDTVAIDGHFYPGLMQSQIGEVYNAGRPAVAFYRERFGGTSIVQASVAAGGGAAIPPKQYATFVIAASDTTDAGKANADAVCTGTDDQTTINTILAAATPSGYRRVLLLEGAFVVNGTITVPSNTVLEGQGDATVVQLSSTFPTNGEVIVCAASASNVQLKSFRLDGNSRPHINTIRLDTSTGATVEGLHLYSMSHARGISHYGGGSDLRIVNCRFSNCNPSQALIDLYASDSVTFRRLAVLDCHIVNLTTDRTAIRVEGDEAPSSNSLPAPDAMQLRDVLVAGCVFGGAGSFFIANYASNIAVAGNTINNCQAGARWRDCFDVTVAGNTVTTASVAFAGVNLYHAEEGGGSRVYVITGNTVRNAAQGVALSGPPAEEGDGTRATEDYRAYAAVTGNTFTNCGASPVALLNVSRVTVAGNAIVQTEDYEGTGNAGFEIQQAWEIVISGNMVSGNLRGMLITESEALLIVGNSFLYNGGGGTATIEIYHACQDIKIADNYFLGAGTNTIHFPNTGGASGAIEIVGNTFWGATHAINNEHSGTAPLIWHNVIRQGDIVGGGIVRDNLDAFGVFQDALRGGGETGAELDSGSLVITPQNGAVSSWISVGADPGDSGVSDWSTLGNADVLTAGGIYIFSPASGDTITVKATGFVLAGSADFVMDDEHDRITMHWTGSTLVELSRSKNTAP